MNKFITHFRLVFFGILSFAVLQSCDNDNEPKRAFQDVPSVRVSNQVKKLRNLLTSSKEGWKVTYFTDNTKLGGITYLFKFLDDKKVEITSDFQYPKQIEKKVDGEYKKVDPPKKTTSEYDVILGSTVKLSFATDAKIDELAMSDWYPTDDLAGKGYKGDFEFLYYGQEGEDLIFRTNRDFIKLRFKKATADDWNKDMAENAASQANNIIGYPLGYQIGTKNYIFSYNSSLRYATSIDNESTDANFGIGFTPTGILISPAVNVAGTKYNEFTFSSDKRQLVSSDGKFIIHILHTPFNLKQNWRIQVNTTDVSPSFLATFKRDSIANVGRYSERLSRRIYLGNTTIRGRTSPGIRFFSYNSPTRGFVFQYLLTFGGIIGQSDELAIYRIGGGFNWRFYQQQITMVDFVVNNAPYKTVPKPPLTDPTEVKLTSTKNPDVWFIIKR